MTQIELEVNEQVLVLDIDVLEETHILLLLFVDLHVAVVSHDPPLQPTGRQSIRRNQVEHVLVLELADCGLRVAHDVGLPGLVEQEFLDT